MATSSSIKSLKIVKPDIDYGNFETLGKGSFGMVIRGKYEGNNVAIKIPTVLITKEDTWHELQTMSKLRHRNVLGLIGVVEDDFHLVFEFMENGSLVHLLTRKTVSNELGFSLMHDIACGMCYLHEMDVVHRDLAARNVLIDGKNRAKVADFGLSRFVDQSGYGSYYYQVQPGRPLPVRWVPKESLPTGGAHGKFSSASDVWSFGVTVWEIWSKAAVPYARLADNDEVQAEIRRGGNPLRHQKPANCPQHVITLLETIFQVDPKKRPKFDSIKLSINSFAYPTVENATNSLRCMDLRDPSASRVSKMDLRRIEKPSAPISQGAMKSAGEESSAGLNTSTLQALHDVAQKFYDENHGDTLDTGYGLASILYALQKYDEALPICRRVLEAQKRVLKEDHRDTLSTGYLFARILNVLQKYDEALPTCRRVLEVQKRVLGEDHFDTLSTGNLLALILNTLDKNEEALPICRRVLEAQKRVLGEDHFDTLTTGNLLARILNALQKYDEALPTCRRVLEAQKRVLGEDHRDTLSTGYLLALILYTLDKNDEALPTCRRVLEAQKRVLGEDHVDTLSTGNLLARILNALQKDEALPTCRRVLEARKRVLGEDHRDTLSTGYLLALILNALQKDDEALPICRRVLEAQKRVLGEHHLDTLKTGNLLASLLRFSEHRLTLA